MALQLVTGARQSGGQAVHRLPAPARLAGGTGLSRQRKTSAGQSNRLRIIGGRWRGRKLDFPDVEGLRPTPDRVRETLFNWLQNDIIGARCLDLFAGSGALGLEALSRGAASATLVDNHANVIEQLRADLAILQSDNGKVIRASALDFLAQPPAHPFDIVFLDPPFGKGLIAHCARLLETNGWLAPGAHIYLEMERSGDELSLPENWELLRDKAAGQVAYRLAWRRPQNRVDTE